MSVVSDKHGYSGGCDDDIAQPAEGIRDLSENEITQNRRENDLAVIVNGNFSCGGEGIGCGDGKLSAGGSKTCQQEGAQLFQCHGMEVEDQVGQGAETGESGEKEHDEGSFDTAGAQCSDISVCHACGQAAHEPDQSRETCQIGGRWFDNEYCANKCGCYTKPLKQIDFFLQDQDAEQDGEEGRHLIQHGGICQYQMIHSVEIAEDADGAAEGTQEQEFF